MGVGSAGGRAGLRRGMAMRLLPLRGNSRSNRHLRSCALAPGLSLLTRGRRVLRKTRTLCTVNLAAALAILQSSPLSFSITSRLSPAKTSHRPLARSRHTPRPPPCRYSTSRLPIFSFLSSTNRTFPGENSPLFRWRAEGLRRLSALCSYLRFKAPFDFALDLFRSVDTSAVHIDSYVPDFYPEVMEVLCSLRRLKFPSALGAGGKSGLG